ncbi:putative acyl- N-acyltransferase [Rosellinia necatrix]|uniref:Putative acyl-N-acyltransferase n=1 Tax=Rosellinia necatrix TaxID=77044 RepID=A0A1W2TPY0_ROSNE|nr:putative acyl- N-acyltransferase [Rosellinia necatrix]
MTTITGPSKFRIFTVPADKHGCRFYLEQYKPFRLASLQQDAQAFGSTYKREVGFDDEAWLGRVKNPLATTFVAVHSDDNHILASTALIGPLPDAKPVSNPYQIVSEATGDNHNDNNDDDDDDDDDIVSREPLCFQMSAVYTIPEARGQGLAKALIRAATEEAHSRARERGGRPLTLSVVVYATNAAAISVYERCGFVKSAEGAKPVFNALKDRTEKELEMCFRGEGGS